MTVITMKRICYGKYNSFRKASIGMQQQDQLYQFVSNRKDIPIDIN